MKQEMSPERGKIEKIHRKPHDAPLSMDQMNRMPGHEEKAKRTRSSKIYSLGRGLYQAVMYPEAVHAKDQDGNWCEIDNTLLEKQDEKGLFFQNKMNPELKLQLRSSESKEMVRLENEDGQVIVWGLEGAQSVSPRILPCNCPQHAEDDLRRYVLDHLDGEAIYEEILPGIDMKCHIKSSSFKDEWVIKNRYSARCLVLRLYTPDMQPDLQEDGAIHLLTATGATPFILPKPFMKTAVEEDGIGAVSVELLPSEDEPDVWHVIYTPDEAWVDKANFPVILDPAVITTQHSSAIEDNFVTSKYPDTVQSYNQEVLRVTKGSGTWGTSKAFIKFLDSGLPEIDSSYYVTKAFFYIHTTPLGNNGYGLSSANPTLSSMFNLHEVTEDWSSSTITYNNAPDVNEEILDYVYIAGGKNSAPPPSWFTYDISNLVRKWYTGVNKGIMLEAASNTWADFYSSDYVYIKPYVLINYVSLAGLESYLAYEQQAVGRAGTGHVSLYNGNLIFSHDDFSTNGNLMPVSAAHYYNSCYRNEDPFGMGLGWKMSLQQTLHRETLEDSTGNVTYYVYMDGDGTRHHFRQILGEWKDLSGLNLTLTISGSTATITDKGDTKMVFDLPTVEFNNNYNNVKMLKTITDACGNVMTLTSDTSRRITNAQDGAGRSTTFAHGTRLSSICPPGYNSPGFCGYEYDENGRLSSIWHLDGENGTVTSTYTYNSLGLLESVTNFDGLKVTYQYYEEREPYRVKQVEISNNGIKYSGRKYVYGDCMTKVIDLIPNDDGTLLSEGKSLIYHFNDYGNVVSVNDNLGYACFAKYSDELPVNHPQTISKMQRSVVNLLNNHSFENTSGWTLTGGMTYATDSKYMGAKALKVTTTGTTTGNHSAQQTVTITPGKTYTLSFYAKKSGNIDIWSCYTYRDAAGVLQYAHQPSLRSQLTTEFTRLSQTFTVPADVSSNQITIILYAGANTGEYFSAWFDCVQLEEGPVANRYNMLVNGDFTLNSNAHPTGWSKNSSNTSSDIVYTTCTGTKPEGLSNNTMRMYGAGVNKFAGIYQDIPVSGSEGDVFSAGGWSFNYSKPRKGEDFRYNIRVAFLKSGTSSTRQNTPSIEWSEEWSDWQFAAGPVVAPCNYSSIRFNVDYERNINYAEFGGLFLHKEEFGKTFAYDDDGNVTSVKNLASMESSADYDDYDNLISYVQPGKPSTEKYTLTWGSTEAEKKKHLLRTMKTPENITTENDYDDKGNQTATRVKNSAASLVIESATTYTEDKNYPLTQTDARGKVVSTITDPNLGTVISVTDPQNQTVNYTYDQLKRVKSVSTTADGKTYRNEYTYENDRIKKVAHNTGSNTECDVEYNFEYDGAGRPTTTYVGTQPLATNVYNPDGTLQKVTFGNSTDADPQEIRYTYDDYKRLKAIQTDFRPKDLYTYEYGANGQVAQMKDNFLHRVSKSEYDTANRPMRITHTVGDSHLYTGEVEYDEYNRLALFKEQVGVWRTPYQSSFEYNKDNKPTKVAFGDENHKVTYQYDGIGRMTSRSLTVGGNASTTSYGYLAGSCGQGNTTGMISYLAQPHESFSYTYDDVGNIASVTQNGKLTAYTYDKLGQLIRVNDQNDLTSDAAGTTWTYEYDRGGNILNKKRYAYTTGDLPSTALETILYGYDTTWKDKLTSYNGTAITYDAIGNPLNDGEWNYQWENGRRLWQMYKGSDGQPGSEFIDFLYNADGLRIAKQRVYYDANGEAYLENTSYTLHGKNIVHLEHEGNNLHFWYDASGKPAVVEFNGVKYGYLQNLQGDIVGIIDSLGNEVVKYTYDAWGKPLSCTGTMAASLGKLNPFRYRGYVFDEETGLYYLRNRYYNPIWNRFSNADSLINGSLFVYATNNPIIKFDPNGTISSLILTSLSLMSSVIQTATDGSVSHFAIKARNEKSEKKDYTYDEPLYEEQKVFIATICAEAIGESKESWIAVGWVMMNRIGHREWRKYDNVYDIIVNTGFNGYGDPLYNDCMAYLNNRDGSNKLYEELINTVMPVYHREMDDPTFFSTMYYTPREGRGAPSFSTSPRVTEVFIEGVNPEKLRFYRYIDDTNPWRMNG